MIDPSEIKVGDVIEYIFESPNPQKFKSGKVTNIVSITFSDKSTSVAYYVDNEDKIVFDIEVDMVNP